MGKNWVSHAGVYFVEVEVSEIESTNKKEKTSILLKKKYDVECCAIECHLCVNGAFAKIIKCLRY